MSFFKKIKEKKIQKLRQKALTEESKAQIRLKKKKESDILNKDYLEAKQRLSKAKKTGRTPVKPLIKSETKKKIMSGIKNYAKQLAEKEREIEKKENKPKGYSFNNESYFKGKGGYF